MLTFKQYNQLDETYKNLFLRDQEERKKYVDQAFDIIKLSYKKTKEGKILTNGFQNKEKLMSYVPFWKLAVVKDKVVAAIFYKDKGGRKSVAAATDGSAIGKAKITEMFEADFKRSFGEKSEAALGFVKKMFPQLVKKYAIKAKDVAGIINAKPGEIELIQGEEFEYIHVFRGKRIKKMMIGTPNKKIK